MQRSKFDAQRVVPALAACLSMVAFACSTSTNPASGGGTGGKNGSGGIAGSGGSSSGGTTQGKGGSSGKGGAAGTGGSSSSGGIGGQTSITGLGGDKPIGSLNPSETTQLCTDAYAYFAKAVDPVELCKWAGLSYGVSSSALNDSLLQQNCKSQEATCLKADPATAECTAIPSSCNATVSQYSACIIDQAAAFNNAVSALPGCATVTKPDLAGVWTYMTADLPEAAQGAGPQVPHRQVPDDGLPDPAPWDDQLGQWRKRGRGRCRRKHAGRRLDGQRRKHAGRRLDGQRRKHAGRRLYRRRRKHGTRWLRWFYWRWRRKHRDRWLGRLHRPAPR